MTNLISEASLAIKASTSTIWQALTDPAIIREYMMGSDVVTTWKVGDPIIWKGEYKGKKYEDHGKILTFIPEETLAYTHFSPVEGKADVPENYHTITIQLMREPDNTVVILTQDNNPDEEAREHAAKFWQGMLETMKDMIEE